MKRLIIALGRLVPLAALLCLSLSGCKPQGDANGFGRTTRYFYSTDRGAVCLGPLNTVLLFYSGIIEYQTDAKRAFLYPSPCDPFTRQEVPVSSLSFAVGGNYISYKDHPVGTIYKYEETAPPIREEEDASFNLFMCYGVTADGKKEVGLGIRIPLDPQKNPDGTIKTNRADVYVGTILDPNDSVYVPDVVAIHTYTDAGNGYDGGGLSAVIPYELVDKAGVEVPGTFSFTNAGVTTTAPITCQWGTNDPPEKAH